MENIQALNDAEDRLYQEWLAEKAKVDSGEALWPALFELEHKTLFPTGFIYIFCTRHCRSLFTRPGTPLMKGWAEARKEDRCPQCKLTLGDRFIVR